MLSKLSKLVTDRKTRAVGLLGGGMGALVLGRKVTALSMFGKGMIDLEREWRLAHPEFDGDLLDRWNAAIDFYEDTHLEPTNRKLHTVGIPLIVGGAVGLLIFRPYRPAWMASAASFTGGWVLNFIGHGFYEKGAPAFADDPLSFIAGPVWDFRYGGQGRPDRRADSAGRSATGAVDADFVVEEINVVDTDAIA